MKHKANWLISIFFILAIFLPFTESHFLHLTEKLGSTENRNMAPKPSLNLKDFKSLENFANQYDAYFNDNFGFRNVLLRLGSLIKLRYLQVSPVPIVIAGKKGWFYYDGEKARDGSPISTYRGTLQYPEKLLRLIKRNIESQKKYLEAHGIRYIILIAPDKATIYPEYMPDTIRVVNPRSCTDQLFDYLKTSHSQMQILDVRDALRNAKAEYPVYFKTDHHWTRVGGFLASQAIVKELSGYFPQVEPLSFSNYQINVQPLKSETDLANMLAMPKQLEDSDVFFHLKPETLKDPAGYKKKSPKLLIFHESFFNGMREFFTDHFENITEARWDPFGLIDYDLIRKVRPDAVIVEIEESYQGALA